MIKKESLGLYKRILSYSFKYPLILITSLLCVVLGGFAEAGLFWLLKPILDEGFVDKNRLFIELMPWLVVGAFILTSVLNFAGSFGMQWISQRVITTLRVAMFDKLLHLPQTAFDKHSTGYFMSKLTFDVAQLMAVSSLTLVSIIKDSAMIIGLVTVMFVNNWQITLLVFLMAPFLYLILRYVSKRLRGISRRMQGHMGEFNHILEEGIRGQKEIKLFEAYDQVNGRFSKVNKDLRHLSMKSLVASQLASPVSQVFLVIFIAFVIWYASNQASADQVTIGSFISLLAAMVGMLTPIKRLVSMNEALQRGAAGAEGVFSILDAEGEKDQGDAKLSQVKGHIEFKDVTFQYEGSEVAALKEISLEIKPYETVALVGASGSGKSTFANLLSRFYNPTSGSISLDGKNIEEIELAAYRSAIGYVGQHVILFADTIAKNISFGNEFSTEEAIEKAAQFANANAFIEKLPEQYETVIGENGAKLSGGQRQRIAIARAILKDAPILIFDEATSSLDNESEYAIQQALKELSREKTTIIIAHRLSTIEHADKIVVFDQGRIVEVGTHQSLLEKAGYYAKLYRVDKK
ncbi:lipid A export permease/ATP-binding protein MsbA [Ignatzschineria cameli]|uniref:lipid A export permease/ATP-binding protein MsbA n=1 Tax=Ignatzschineria cameli TaxID=2182793 RepID=UPI001EFC9A44|nr:lipid A export permease/ATP-binding protein MsbA [Ignatzschineria cameli]